MVTSANDESAASVSPLEGVPQHPDLIDPGPQFTNTGACLHVHVHAHMCVHVHVHVCIYTCIHVHVRVLLQLMYWVYMHAWFFNCVCFV